MAKTGRPKKKIDWEQFDRLCLIQCTLEEIASFFDCSADTIERAVKREHGVTFAEHFGQKRGKGKISLRRAMWTKAIEGNPTMMIWLSKNYLGMTDKLEQEIRTDGSKEYKIGWEDDAGSDPVPTPDASSKAH